ncbi:MAG: PH domain-containing protein [Bacillota bacterium]|nr:PH domain-containing protein [Bacillota bacterium]
MYKPKRLHPISILVSLGGKIKKLLFPLLAVLFFGQKGSDKAFISLIISLIVIFFSFFSSFISWFRFTYFFEDGELRMEHGVFIRKKRHIPFERIQSIDISQGVLQRMFGLVRVQMETAGGVLSDGAEAVLSAISKREAEFIQAGFSSFKKIGQMVAAPDSTPVYQITTGQLLLLSLTSGGVGVIISAMLAFLSQMDDMVPLRKIFGRVVYPTASSLLLVVSIAFLGLFVLWIVALIRTMLKYANFTVTKNDDDLVISQGLFEKRQITIPLNRIQAIRLSESFVRQLTGYASVFIESAGGTSVSSEGSSVVLLPMVKADKINSIIGPFLKDYQITSMFNPIPKRAMYRYIFKTWYIGIPIVILSLYFLKLWGLFSLIFLLGISIWAILKFKDAGWNIENQQLSIRYRLLIRHTLFMKKNKIQALKVHESYFQRKKNLATVDAFIKSGKGMSGGHVTDLDQKDIQDIFIWYAAKKEG